MAFSEAFTKLAQGQTGHLAIVSADVDCFAALNLVDGWQVGDRVLLELSEIVKKRAQFADCLTRRGAGFLFAMLVPDTTNLQHEADEMLGDFKPILDSVCSAEVVEQLKVVSNHWLTATVALVSAKLPAPHTFESMYSACTAALVEGKIAGGGQVVVKEL